MRVQTDFLIVGSGIAGLSFALKVAKTHPDRKVLVVTKADKDESNTKYAQGGMAAVSDFKRDNYEKHVSDTLIAGDGLCDKSVVDMVVKSGPEMVQNLINWGVEFDTAISGKFDLGREGGHSEKRVIHHKDITGLEIETSLISSLSNHANITVLENLFALELITQHHLNTAATESRSDITCFGIYALNTETRQVDVIQSRITLLATGGIGQVYQNTTNPVIATGDGIAMAYRAKARIDHMEFIQFHPTALFYPGKTPSYLISEAVRGFGAILINSNGTDFMREYDDRGSLAPRDIVARAIDRELKKLGEDHVFLDCTHLEAAALEEKFPNIIRKCKSLGIDPFVQPIPVVPAAHYNCGGIRSDIRGRTTIVNLYACGECACTGLHGANRLASNSLLEALVYAEKCHLDSSASILDTTLDVAIPEWNISGVSDSREAILITHNRRELRSIMSDYVGIFRSDTRLDRALKRILILHAETEKLYDRATLSVPLCELRNLIAVAYLIVTAAINRKDNIGLHYNVDQEKE